MRPNQQHLFQAQEGGLMQPLLSEDPPRLVAMLKQQVDLRGASFTVAGESL